jgi:drug/metabolite transporter (DMT)-like permease
MCDFGGSTLLAFALLNMETSIYQMLRGGLVLVTALLSRIFLKNKQYRHHLLGLFVVVSALFLVGLSSFTKEKEPDSIQTNALGIIMMGLSLLFAGVQFVVEEVLLSQYCTHPLKVVGWEGFWGTSVYIIILIIFQNVSCNSFDAKLQQDLCSIDDTGEWKLENSIFALRQMGADGFLFFLVVGVTFTIAFYNFCGVSVTRYASSPVRAVVDNLRTILVWLFFLIVPTSKKETFSWIQLVGFVLLVVGTVIYNEVLVLPFLGFDQNTKEAIAKREAEGGNIPRTASIKSKSSFVHK